MAAWKTDRPREKTDTALSVFLLGLSVFQVASLEDGQQYVRLRRFSYNGSPVNALPKHGPFGMGGGTGT